MNPSLLPLTCVASLLAIESDDVGSCSLRSWICIGVCIAPSKGYHLLSSDASPVDYVFYIFFEAELFWVWERAPRTWCCCKALLSIVDEHIEAIFYALGDNGDFKVCFCMLIFDRYRYLLSKQWNSLSYARGFIRVGNLMCWLSPCQHGRICWPLQRHLYEIWKGKRGVLRCCLHLVDVPYTDISFSCMVLEVNLWWAQMWKNACPS